MNILTENFGILPNGNPAELFTLSNGTITASITNYGGILTSLYVPDSHGKLEDIVLGYDNLDAYVKDSPHFGCITGRYANRIKNGQFPLNGRTYQLDTNDGNNHLHGGHIGLDKQLWEATTNETDESISLILTHTSSDGTAGYPGNLLIAVIYQLHKGNNDLSISYQATTDKSTPVNLTNHSYFNLRGASSGSILDHLLTLNASHYTTVDEEGIPFGTQESVKDTPFDFTTARKIGERIEERHPQLYTGYDHNWIIDPDSAKLTVAAVLHEPKSGRMMEVLTDQPAIQFYSGNFLDGSHIGKSDTEYHQRSGLCLETQIHPDAPNQPTYPDCILHPGETYEHTCVYRFK